MGDQQAASLESLIFVYNVYSPSALSVLCVHGVLILMWACVGLGGQAGGSGLCLAGPLLGGSSALEPSGRFEGKGGMPTLAGKGFPHLCVCHRPLQGA